MDDIKPKTPAESSGKPLNEPEETKPLTDEPDTPGLDTPTPDPTVDEPVQPEPPVAPTPAAAPNVQVSQPAPKVTVNTPAPKVIMKNKKSKKKLIAWLVVLLLVAAGAAAYFMYQKEIMDYVSGVSNSNNQSQASDDNSSNSGTDTDETDRWVTYSSEVGQYNFKHPETWVFADNLELCNAGLVLLAPTKESVGKCASEDAGLVSVSSQEGDLRAEYELSIEEYSDVEEQAIEVANTEGKKLSGKAKGAATDEMGPALPKDTKVVRYVFFKNSRTYIASYTQQPNDPDALKTFEKIVTKTFKFES